MTISAVFCAYDKPGIVGGTSSWIQRLLPALADHGITARCLVFLHTGEKGPVSAELESAMKGHIVGEAQLVGTYQKQAR